MIHAIQTIRTYRHDEVVAIARMLITFSAQWNLMTFEGPIGAGKTTLIRAFLRLLGVSGAIVSPTFTYITCYRTSEGRSVYHFDLYRIGDAQQFEMLGFHEYLNDPEALILIEWPAVIEPLLSKKRCHILLDYAVDPEKRVMSITVPKDMDGV